MPDISKEKLEELRKLLVPPLDPAFVQRCYHRLRELEPETKKPAPKKVR